MGRKAQARDRILESARLLFWRKGYTAVGVDEICQTAGVNKGSLYHYFRDKEALALAIIEINAGAVFEKIETSPGARDPGERILAYLDWMIGGQTAEGRGSGQFAGCPFGRLAAETAGTDPGIRDAVEAVFQKLLKFIARNLGELAPNISKKEIKNKAQEIFMNWQGALILSQARNSAQPLKHTREITAELLADWRTAS